MQFGGRSLRPEIPEGNPWLGSNRTSFIAVATPSAPQSGIVRRRAAPAPAAAIKCTRSKAMGCPRIRYECETRYEQVTWYDRESRCERKNPFGQGLRTHARVPTAAPTMPVVPEPSSQGQAIPVPLVVTRWSSRTLERSHGKALNRGMGTESIDSSHSKPRIHGSSGYSISQHLVVPPEAR